VLFLTLSLGFWKKAEGCGESCQTRFLKNFRFHENKDQNWYGSCNQSGIFKKKGFSAPASQEDIIMTQNILDLNEALVSKILYDFDTELQTRFSSSLFQFILATDEISDGMFHDTVRRVWRDAGPQGLRSYLGRELILLEDYREQHLHKLGS